MSNGAPKYFEIRLAPKRINQYDFLMSKNIIAIGWPDIGDLSGLSKNSDRKEIIKKKLNSKYEFKTKQTLTQVAVFFVRLLDMQPGDYVVIPNTARKRVTIARVAGKYQYDNSNEYATIEATHQVAIKDAKSYQINKLSQSLRNRLRAQLTVTLIGTDDKREEIKALFEHKEGPNEDKDAQAYINTINNLKTEFNDSNLELTKRSLLLSAFSLAEGYISSEIYREMPIINKKSTKGNQQSLVVKYGIEFMRTTIDKGFQNKSKVYKRILNEPKDRHPIADSLDKVGDLPCHLRNALAHDITTPSFDDEYKNITFEYKSRDQNIEIDRFFSCLIKLAKDIEKRHIQTD